MINEIVAIGVAVFVYVIIFSERVHRTIIGLFGAVAMTLLGEWLGFYSQEAALESIDFNTLFLLMGMMIFVGLFKKTGAFEALSVWIAKLVRGNGVLLLVALGSLSAMVSTVIDNVTTLIFMAPITVTIAQSLGISAVPLLMAEAMLSNIGGIATLIGDPPNILIGSAAELGFLDFLVHLSPMVVVILAFSLGVIVLMFRRQLTISPEKYQQFMARHSAGMVKDWSALRRLLTVLLAGLLLFIVHDWLHLQPAAVALLIAATSLLWVRPSLEAVLSEVEWNVLLFFGALFVLVGGLESVGVLGAVAGAIGGFAQDNYLAAMLGLLWGSALLSAVLDNIPFTVVTIPIILELQRQGLDVGPLWWTLALGVGLGGNGTPIGSTAGLIAVSYSERMGNPITFKRWLRDGMLVTLVGLVMASILLLALYGLGWL